MTIARETIEFQRLLAAALPQALPPAAVARVNLGGLVSAAGPALAAGWPGAELARLAIIGAACGDSPGAIIATNLKGLAAGPPARPATAPTEGQGMRITAPGPLPECAGCGQPFRRDDARIECPACGAVLRLVQFDHQAAAQAARALRGAA